MLSSTNVLLKIGQGDPSLPGQIEQVMLSSQFRFVPRRFRLPERARAALIITSLRITVPAQNAVTQLLLNALITL